MIQTLTAYRNLSRNVHVLFIAKIIIASGNFVYPFLTLFLSEKLQFPADKVGILLGVATFGSLLGTTIGGTLADFFERKRVLLLSFLCAATSYVLVILPSSPVVIVALLLLGLMFTSASIPPYNALVADITEGKERRTAFSLLYLGSNIGFTFGPLIAAYLFTHAVQLIFVGDALATSMSMLMIWLFVRGKPAGRTGKATPGMSQRDFFTTLRKNPTVVAFLLIFMAHPFIFSQLFFSLPLRMNALFVEKGVSLYGSIVMLNGISVIVLTPFVTRLTLGVKPIFNIAVGGLFYAVGFGLCFFVRDFLWLCAATVVWSAGEILSTTNSEVYIADRAQPEHRARLNMMLEINYEIGFGLGPFIIGYLITILGIMNIWPVIVSIALVSSLLLIIIGSRRELGA